MQVSLEVQCIGNDFILIIIFVLLGKSAMQQSHVYVRAVSKEVNAKYSILLKNSMVSVKHIKFIFHPLTLTVIFFEVAE